MKTVKPIFKHRGVDGNYNSGYVGFSYRSTNLVSRGIAIFTRGEYKGIVPSHAFYVVDSKKIIEATGEGVHYTDINHYFDDPSIIVFFRRPRGLDSEKVRIMTEYADSIVGREYDYGLITHFVLRYLLIDRLQNLPWLRKKPSLFDTPQNFICSEAVASILNQIPEYSNLLPLSEYHSSKIDPLQLFRGDIFEPWGFV
jgi:hypothetical protein